MLAALEERKLSEAHDEERKLMEASDTVRASGMEETIVTAKETIVTAEETIVTMPLSYEWWSDTSIPMRFTLSQSTEVTHNSRRLVFKLPSEEAIFLLPPCSHVICYNETGTKRAYTPISAGSRCGEFDLLVKTYEKGVMSTYLTNLEVGASVAMTAKRGAFHYEPSKIERIVMLCGGTGLAPMYQVRHSFPNHNRNRNP